MADATPQVPPDRQGDESSPLLLIDRGKIFIYFLYPLSPGKGLLDRLSCHAQKILSLLIGQFVSTFHICLLFSFFSCFNRIDADLCFFLISQTDIRQQVRNNTKT